MNLKRIAVTATAVAVAAMMVTPAISTAGVKVSSAEEHAVPRYNHIVEIMMENTKYSDIIGNTLAPNLNRLASKYGLATNYFGVTHPSEPNYITNIGGDYFGIQDDNQFYCTPAMATTDPYCGGTTVDHIVNAPSLADQLTAAHKSWKGYFQSLPPTPSTYIKVGPTANGPYTFKYPSNSNALYASKHNPFLNFTGTVDAVQNMVSDTQLPIDLAHHALPTFSLVVPDQCHDMHGTGSCYDTNGIIAAGDTYVADTVRTITSSPAWREGNNAIVITWDEDDYSDVGVIGTGCCGANPGGGHVATIVLTNHSDDHVVDNTAYNHYSLLRTFEDAFGLPTLGHAGDSVVPAMTPLFRKD